MNRIKITILVLLISASAHSQSWMNYFKDKQRIKLLYADTLKSPTPFSFNSTYRVVVWDSVTKTFYHNVAVSSFGGGAVSSVGSGYGLSGGPITTTGTLLVDSATLSAYYVRRKDSSTFGGYYPYATNPKNYLTSIPLTSTYIGFGNGSNVLTGDATLSWDNTNHRLNIYGASAGSLALSINSTTNGANRTLFYEDGSAELVKTGGGNIGIGTAKGGGVMLDVRGSSTITPGALFRGFADTDPAVFVNSAANTFNRHVFYGDGRAKLGMDNSSVIALDVLTTGITANQPLTLANLTGSTNRLLYIDASEVVQQSTVSPTKIPYNLNTTTADVGNVGTGEDDLITYSVPAGQLSTNGDYLEGTMAFHFATNANSKTLTFYFGSDILISTSTIAASGGGGIFTFKIIRTGAATQEMSYTWVSTNNANIVNTVSGTQTLSGAITLKATGTGVNNDDIIQRNLNVKYVPN